MVSIRAPTVRPGRQIKNDPRVAWVEFQSAPRPCGRGDRFHGACRCIGRGFNPRPDRAAGATRLRCASDNRHGVSIRAPTVRPGRPRHVNHSVAARLVSIRAPTVRPGRQTTPRHWIGTSMFQSAPRPCGRGDSTSAISASRVASFQSAPRPCGRGDKRSAPRGCPHARFNPRPDRAAGATRCGLNSRRSVCVSIRAPTVRPGRLFELHPPPRLLTFQSAPRPCGRGDL